MGRKGIVDRFVPRLRRYMAEQDRLLTTGEVQDLLGLSQSSAYNALIYMEALGMIDHVKIGRKHLYYLKGAYDENQLAAMLPRVRAPRMLRRRRRVAPAERKTESIPEEHAVGLYPGAPGGMLPALAVLGLYKTEPSKPQTQPQPKPVREPTTPIFITVERHGRVKHLPKEVRLLSKGDTTYLKERYLKVLDGYDEIERFDTFFAESSALERREYGNVFYASMGTNPWHKVYKVMVERGGQVSDVC